LENVAAAGPSIVEQLSLMQLLVASKNTLLLTLLSMPLAVTLGLILALMRKSRLPFVFWPASIYIEVVRGTPLLMQLYLVYYSLPQVGQWVHAQFPAISDEWFILNNFTVGVMCLAGNYAAYEAEIHRAGLDAVDKGQREAALSIGMSERQAFFRVVLPQAVRVVIPPIINDLIAMLKDSSLVSIIGVTELLNVAMGIGKGRSNVAQMLVVAAAFYLVLSLPCYFIGKWIERRLKAQGAPELHLENVHGH
jgi:His/Glu/Gln/Arg/opine family amino acid ABC transporter permease subunit